MKNLLLLLALAIVNVILITPTGDVRVNLDHPEDPLTLCADAIHRIAAATLGRLFVK